MLKCWLCGRAIGTRLQWHHTIPKAKRGTVTVPLHPICHRTIHIHFTNAQLARIKGAREPLLENTDIQRFLHWIADKPPDFHAPTRRKR
ncbi:HNH endonuclease [Altericroceibacterium spongiae]|uniref:HNH endonuclease n=1 Tax=Altericroceibacterium spongiae TaxID=2320269 RepID=A0A420EN64_9SPHN|nr:HNH endonuclease [Altericroceibacterium spongiae]